MKRMLSMLMILALLLGSTNAFAQDDALSGAEMESAEMVESFEEEEQEIFELHGEIVEITEEYVLINTADMGYVQANLSEDTVIEVVDVLEVGQTAVVMYNGMMTRSLPPQISALHIGVYAVSGVVAEVLEDSLVIVSDETGEQIILTLPTSELLDEKLAEEIENEAGEELGKEIDEEAGATSDSEESEDEQLEDELIKEEAVPAFNVGDKIIAYTTGAMTMSLPPQMNALAIILDLGDETAEAVAEIAEESEETEDGDQSEETIG